MKQPLVTIIITCHNYADYVRQAIESAVNQTYKNTQIIVIDDGSTDESLEVISSCKKSWSLEVINQNENRGIIATRNHGMALAKGDYVMQLDADDYLEETYVQECLDAAIESSLDIVYTQVRIFGRAEFISEYIDFDLEKLKHSNYIHATALIKRSILPEKPYDPYLDDKGYEDWDLFLDLCLDGARAKLVDRPLLNYRKHTEFQSRSDTIGGTIKEVLVRHHILSKQNAKHPEEFWYFSSEIDLLLGMIRAHESFAKDADSFSQRISALESERTRLEARLLKSKLKGAARHASRYWERLRALINSRGD